jgi:ABC-type dipeptide/oligopeptide/nickel transport system permease component
MPPGTSPAKATEARRASPRSGSMRALRAAFARALEATLVLFVLASLVFFALRLLPGDPARLVLGDQASASEVAEVRARLHLDEPLGAQYARFLYGIGTADLGDSFRRPGVPAARRVGSALVPTAELAGLAVAMGSALGLALAALAYGPWLGAGRRWVEDALVAMAASPLVAFAPVLTYALAARARLVPLPGDPEAGFAGLAFASALLAVPLSAHVGRTARAALEELSHGQFLTVAAAKGATSRRVVFLHALPAASGPILAVIATQLGALLGGAVVLERLFERWGLGTLILEAYASRDLPVLEGAVVAAGALFVLVQSLATLLHAALDPRARA